MKINANSVRRKNTKGLDKANMSAVLDAFINNTEVGIYVSDYYTGEVLFINRKMANYAGEATMPELVGRICWTLVDPENTERCHFCPYKKLLDKNGRPTEPYAWEFYLEKADLWIKSINQVITWSTGRLAQMVTFYDITEIKKMQKRLADIAYTDKFLSLKNEVRLERDIEDADERPSLIVLDITSLHKVNDAHGRTIGDCLLLAVKDWFTGNMPAHSELYRIGGDEFCMAVKASEPEVLRKFADDLLQRFEEPWNLNENGINCEIFCNAAIAIIINSFMPENEPVLNLIERTLKTAKNRKTVAVYDEIMDRDYKERLRFELCLKKCVRSRMEGFDVHYQPIINPKSGKWQGLEALCRWCAPVFGNVSPEIFIPEAERLELIDTLGMWVMERAVAECKAWGLDSLDGFFLDVNVSSSQFFSEKLACNILKILSDNDYPGDKLCLEITESTKFTFTGSSMDTISLLRANNIKVALDDFGRGYSNFHQIKNMPSDIVKIEKDFIKDIGRDDFQQYLFRSILELTHTAGMKLIAEGIENETQAELLINSDADYLQGYFYSKPLPAVDVGKMLHFFGKIGP